MKKKYAIQVKNLSKMYKIYSKPSNLLKEIFFRKKYHDQFWALKNISFDVKKGEVVGIIGRNGAGKSTLLKILAQTLDKTKGKIKMDGKISAILELGSGFHPEYSGRENIYNGGMILGMSKKKIEQKIQSIIDFSELGEFIDRPFKTYSSGMKVRLSFSVATAIEPEILIIDEALASGDIYFMGKCINKIREICERENITVLFVSHNTHLVQRLCNKTLWLENGKIEKLGPTIKVVKAYETFVRNLENKNLKKQNKKELQKKLISQLDGIKISKIETLNQNQKKTNVFNLGEPIIFRTYFTAKKDFRNLAFCLEVYRQDGAIMFSSNSHLAFDDKFRPKSVKVGPIKNGTGYVDIKINQNNLGPQTYLLSAGIFPIENYKNFYDWHDREYRFKVFKSGYPLANTVEYSLKYKLHQKKKQ